MVRSRIEHQVGASDIPHAAPSKCAKVLYYTWRLCSVVFSHLVMMSLVVAYCLLGAVTFEKLEADHEKDVKKNISRIRDNTTHSIWSMTRSAPLLDQHNWTSEVVHMLQDFESSLLLEMKVRGWDGNESEEHLQWTFTGALFYSIVVITTIGYGHLTPKTQTGKVVTILYAILGIPLMLLTLSNIGDVMASSFRFLYWRVCCYVCTRPPKKRRRRQQSIRRSVRSRQNSTRHKKPLERAHSDTDFRYRDSGYGSPRARRGRQMMVAPHRTRSQPPVYARKEYDFNIEEEYSTPRIGLKPEYSATIDRVTLDEFPKISLPLEDLDAALKDLDAHQKKIENRSKSLPRPAKYSDRRNDRQSSIREEYEMHDLRGIDYENFKERIKIETERNRRTSNMSDVNLKGRCFGEDAFDEESEFDARPRYRRTWDERRYRRGNSEQFEPELYPDRSHVVRRAHSAAHYRPTWDEGRTLRRLRTVDDTRHDYDDQYYQSLSATQDDWSDEEAAMGLRMRSDFMPRHMDIVPVQPENFKEEIKPVPIWLCVFLVASYIVTGTFLFKRWEGWAYLDAAYFCFITLTTIGFGDFVPAQSGIGATGDPRAAVHSIALCSLYLLFGIALLAMSFNLVQEEVRANVRALATKLGIIKSHEDEDDDDLSDY